MSKKLLHAWFVSALALVFGFPLSSLFGAPDQKQIQEAEMASSRPAIRA